MASSTNDVIAVLDSIGKAFVGTNEVDRLRVRTAVRRLLFQMETPFERAWGLCLEHPVLTAALKTGIDIGLWKAWTAVDGGKKTIDELVGLTGQDIEPNLLRRLFRLLAAFSVVEETAEDTFKPTPFSLAIGNEKTRVENVIRVGTNQYIPSGHTLPKYLAKIGYKEPTAAENSNHSESDPDGLNFFGRLQKVPEYYDAFTGMMEGWTLWKTPWTQIYDPKKLLDGARLENGSPLVVDLGGNTGIDITQVLRALPDLPAGSLVLQDLPEMVARANLDKRIVTQAHDFFLPQPVKGSRAYFIHAVVHDWPDDKATVLLRNTQEAMVKGYSKLFIYDVVVPTTGASISQTTLDVEMMSLLSGAERTKSEWEKLLAAAGLKIVNIWPDPRQIESLIEAEVV